jgi:hypothetical protein
VSKIAELFDVSEQTIITENNIKKGSLRTGQDLTILPVSGVSYRVAEGDNI